MNGSVPPIPSHFMLQGICKCRTKGHHDKKWNWLPSSTPTGRVPVLVRNQRVDWKDASARLVEMKLKLLYSRWRFSSRRFCQPLFSNCFCIYGHMIGCPLLVLSKDGPIFGCDFRRDGCVLHYAGKKRCASDHVYRYTYFPVHQKTLYKLTTPCISNVI